MVVSPFVELVSLGGVDSGHVDVGSVDDGGEGDGYGMEEAVSIAGDLAYSDWVDEVGVFSTDARF